MRKNRVLDKCFGNIKGAYTAKSLPPLSDSAHSTVDLMPTYRSVLKSNKPQKKPELLWTEDSVDTLRGCCGLRTVWTL